MENNNTQFNINVSSEFIAGLIQGDGSLFVAVSFKSNAKWDQQLRPKCVITLDKEFKGKELLEIINSYFDQSGKSFQ